MQPEISTEAMAIPINRTPGRAGKVKAYLPQ